MMKSSEKLNILVVEDNKGDAHLVKVYLKESKLKHTFFHAESLYDATDTIGSNPIDLVILDLSLPDSNGFRTISTFLERHPELPVIVMTGQNNELIGTQAIKGGAQDYLVKGQFTADLLGRAVRYSLQRHKQQLRLEEAARTLSMSEKRYIEAQEMAHFGNWEVDIVTNQMKWTKEVYRIFGMRPNSIAPSVSDYIIYVHPEDKEMVSDYFEDAAKDGKLHKLEHRIIVDGHKIRHVATQAKVFYDDIVDKILLVGAIQDITERKQAEQLLIERNMSERSSKVREEILEDMSFHIRTPLSSLLNLSFLLEKTTPSPQQEEYIGGMKASIDDLSITVNNLLNFSVLVSEKVNIEEVEFNIHEFVQSIQRVMQIRADNKKLNIEFNIADNVPKTLISDSMKLNQIAYNLLDNAIKYTDEGTITFSIEASDVENDTTNLLFKIKDTGRGMNVIKLDELMGSDQLLRLDYNGENKKQGLGLAIVNKLIETMDGKIKVDSREQEGTQFFVEIPVQVVRRSPIQLGDKPTKALRILLVEDHFLNQIATKRVLTTWSDYVTVDIAENGQIAIDKCREYEYSMIFMDLQMPVMNGIEATENIREFCETPVIGLSANSNRLEMERCYDAGMNDYLAKPFKPQDLYLKIMGLLVNEAPAVQNS